MKHNVPHWKIVATGAGIGITVTAGLLNAEYVAATEGWLSSLVLANVMLTVGAALALPMAERARETGQWLKAITLVVFFALVVAGSLLAAISRVGTYRDDQVATGQQVNVRASLAAEAYAAAQATAADECTKRGPRCRAAETAVTLARSELAATAPPRASDPAAARLAVILGISEATVALYAPLLWPIALELGGFVLLALGLSPGRREEEPHAEAMAQLREIALTAKPKSGSRAYYVARLTAERPDLAAQVDAGELSVYKACIAAGYRKAPHPSTANFRKHLETA